jgi:hypothetical protein
MNSFLIDSFKGGISDYEDKGVKGAYKFGQALDIRKDADTLSCQQALVEENTGAIIDRINWFVPASDGNVYGFGDTGKIYKRTPAGVWTMVYNNTGEADVNIRGACEWTLNTGVTYLFWTTATRLNCKEIPGNTGWTDVNALSGYPKTNLTDETYHTISQAVGSLLIGNGAYLAMVGYDGSYTNQALNLGPGHKVVTILERNRYAIIGSYMIGNYQQSALTSWDTISLSWNDRRTLFTGLITSAIDTDVPLIYMGYPLNASGGLYYSDMQNSLPLLTIAGRGQSYPGGITNDEGVALLGIYNNTSSRNGVYSYGRRKKNQLHSLNLEYPLTCDTTGGVGKFSIYSGSDYTFTLIGYRNGVTCGVKRVDTTAKATGYYYSLDLKAPSRFGYMPVWSHVTLSMKPLPASCTVEVYYKLDKAGSFIQAVMEGGTAAFSTTNGQEAIFLLGEKAKILEVEIKLTPSANTCPEIMKAEVYFE